MKLVCVTFENNTGPLMRTQLNACALINSYCLACWWIVQIITPRRNYFPRATPEGNNSFGGDNLHYPPTSQAITVLLYRTFYNKGQNHKTRPELISIF